MRTTLNVLDSSGHLQLVWAEDNPEEVANARAEVAKLKAAGYQFFLVDNGSADEVAAGQGKLDVRRVEAEVLTAGADLLELVLPDAPSVLLEPEEARRQAEMAV